MDQESNSKEKIPQDKKSRIDDENSCETCLLGFFQCIKVQDKKECSRLIQEDTGNDPENRGRVNEICLRPQQLVVKEQHREHNYRQRLNAVGPRINVVEIVGDKVMVGPAGDENGQCGENDAGNLFVAPEFPVVEIKHQHGVNDDVQVDYPQIVYLQLCQVGIDHIGQNACYQYKKAYPF